MDPATPKPAPAPSEPLPPPSADAPVLAPGEEFEPTVVLPDLQPVTVLESEEAETEDERRMLSVKLNGEAHRALLILSKAMDLSKTEIVELAVALFYRNYFEREGAQLADIVVFLDELAGLTQEHSEQVGSLVETCVTLVDAEAELSVDFEKP